MANSVLSRPTMKVKIFDFAILRGRQLGSDEVSTKFTSWLTVDPDPWDL